LLPGRDVQVFAKTLQKGRLRKDVERLIDVLIEMLDVVDVDPDFEPNGDGFENDMQFDGLAHSRSKK
jgi:hypothetical protein